MKRLVMSWVVFSVITAAPCAPAEEGPAAFMPDMYFVSGDATGYDAGTKIFNVRVYLDAAGDPTDRILGVSVKENTEITDGEAHLTPEALIEAGEVDVEYNEKNEATYIFIY